MLQAAPAALAKAEAERKAEVEELKAAIAAGAARGKKPAL